MPIYYVYAENAFFFKDLATLARSASILKNQQQPKWVGMCCLDSTLSNNRKFKYLLGIYGLRGIFLLGLSFNMPIYYVYAENAFFFLICLLWQVPQASSRIDSSQNWVECVA